MNPCNALKLVMGKSNFTAGCGTAAAGSGCVDVDKDKRGKKRDAREGGREDRTRSLRAHRFSL